MVEPQSNSRLSSIKPVILTQTDTTVGFVSQNKSELEHIKSRESSKPFLKVYTSYKELLNSNHRIPQNYKNLLRRSRKTTFIVKNKAFRIAKYPSSSQILRNMKWSYSTSANARGQNFAFDFCEDKAGIIIHNRDGLNENSSSRLIKISNSKKVRLR